MSAWRWFKVADADRKHAALVKAIDVREACRVYLDEHRPDLYAGFATPEEIAAWEENPVPWPDPEFDPSTFTR